MALPAIGDDSLLEVLNDFMKSKTETKDLHNNVVNWREWYNFQHYQNRGEKKPFEERFNDPTPTNVVDLAVGIILAHPMEISAHGLSPSLVEQENTSKIEKYLNGTLTVNSEREEYEIIYESTMHTTRDGVAVIFSAWDPILEEEFKTEPRPVPDRESPQGFKLVPHLSETPVRIQVIDPLKVTWIKGGPRRWEQVFRAEEKSVFDVENLYGVRLKNYAHLDERQKKEQKGELIDHWRWAKTEQPIIDPGSGQPVVAANIPQTQSKWVVKRALLFDNEFVWPLMDTPYDDLPYSMGFYKPLDRDKSAGWTAGAIQPLQTTVVSLENAINRRARQITLLSSLPIISKAMAGRNITIDKALGTHVPLQPDEDLAFPKWPGNPPDVADHIDFLRGRLQASGFAESAFGEGASAVSGYAISQQTDQNRIRLEQPVRHLEFMWASIFKKIMRMTSKFGPDTSIQVYGTMRGKDFAESIIAKDFKDYMITVKFKPEFPGEQQRKVAMAVQSQPFLSLSTILERYYDIQQPDDEMDKRIMDMARQDPMIIKYAVMKNLQELADSGDEVAQMVMQQAQQEPIEGSAAGKMQGRPNMTGTQSADGTATPQAEGGKPPGQGAEAASEQMERAAPGLT